MEYNSAQILEESLKIHLEYKEQMAISSSYNKDTLRNKMQTAYPYIFEKFPSILNIAISDSYNYDRLKFMLNTSAKITANELSERDASIQVGQVLVDDIVKPMLKKNESK